MRTVPRFCSTTTTGHTRQKQPSTHPHTLKCDYNTVCMPQRTLAMLNYQVGLATIRQSTRSLAVQPRHAKHVEVTPTYFLLPPPPPSYACEPLALRLEPKQRTLFCFAILLPKCMARFTNPLAASSPSMAAAWRSMSLSPTPRGCRKSAICSADTQRELCSHDMNTR